MQKKEEVPGSLGPGVDSGSGMEAGVDGRIAGAVEGAFSVPFA